MLLADDSNLVWMFMALAYQRAEQHFDKFNI